MLDTNICIYLLKRQPAEVQQRFDSLQRGDVVLSVITLAELRYGAERDPSLRAQAHAALDALTELIPVLPFAAAAASCYGVLRAAVRDRSRDALDKLIAAHAVSEGLVLVTNNVSDFSGFPGLMVENWVAGSGG